MRAQNLNFGLDLSPMLSMKVGDSIFGLISVHPLFILKDFCPLQDVQDSHNVRHGLSMGIGTAILRISLPSWEKWLRQGQGSISRFLFVPNAHHSFFPVSAFPMGDNPAATQLYSSYKLLLLQHRILKERVVPAYTFNYLSIVFNAVPRALLFLFGNTAFQNNKEHRKIGKMMQSIQMAHEWPSANYFLFSPSQSWMRALSGTKLNRSGVALTTEQHLDAINLIGGWNFVVTARHKTTSSYNIVRLRTKQSLFGGNSLNTDFGFPDKRKSFVRFGLAPDRNYTIFLKTICGGEPLPRLAVYWVIFLIFWFL
jgi:hypothetical protein